MAKPISEKYNNNLRALYVKDILYNDAATEYELYQAGHYYLVSHGQWTEVSHGKYIVALISEIVGISSFVIAVVLNLIRILSGANQKNK